MIFVIVQPDLADGNDFVVAAVGDRVGRVATEQCAQGAELLLRVGIFLAVLRVNPESRVHAGVAGRLRENVVRVLIVGRDVDNAADVAAERPKHAVEQRVGALALVRVVEAGVVVMRVGIKQQHKGGLL